LGKENRKPNSKDLTLIPQIKSEEGIEEGKKGGSDSENPRRKFKREKRGRRKKGRTLTLIPFFSIRMNEKKEIKGKENESARTNPKPTIFPHSDKPEKNNSKKERGKKV
jgi:hypothetical protein